MIVVIVMGMVIIISVIVILVSSSSLLWSGSIAIGIFYMFFISFRHFIHEQYMMRTVK